MFSQWMEIDELREELRKLERRVERLEELLVDRDSGEPPKTMEQKIKECLEW